jgi:hypothetical protein
LESIAFEDARVHWNLSDRLEFVGLALRFSRGAIMIAAGSRRLQ